MTKRQLAIAQFLYSTAESAEKYADQIDPKRLHRDDLSRSLDAIGQRSRDAFFTLTGRNTFAVSSLVELNTEHPAGWTRERS